MLNIGKADGVIFKAEFGALRAYLQAFPRGVQESAVAWSNRGPAP
jgi:hypothetical protein